MTSVLHRVRRKAGRIGRAVVVPADVDSQLAQYRQQLDRQAKQIDTLKTGLADLRTRFRPVELASANREVQHGRLKVQVGVFEERMGRLEQRLASGTFVADDAELAEARSLVEAVQREHEQARIRMQIVSHYEERLRRVEDALVNLYEGDVRHPI